MPRAIVTYARGWQALSVVRSLGKQGIEVICGEEAAFAPCFFSRYCTDHFQYPSFADDPAAFLETIVRKVEQYSPGPDEPYVLMPIHKETWLLAEHRERLEPRIRMAITSHENMKRVHDKGSLADLAGELGIPIPPTFQPRSLDELYRMVPDIGLPAFVKVREGASGVGIKRVTTREELVGVFRKFVEGYGLEPDSYPLVQQGVAGTDHCVTALFDHGRLVASMTYRNVRQFPRETGASALRETVEAPEAEAAAEKILSHLGWHGIAELDYRIEEDGTSHLIEINPRIFGGLPQCVASNVDYPHMLFRIASGERIESPPEVRTDVRTETPVISLLATIDDIARDPDRLEKLETLRRELEKPLTEDLEDVEPKKLIAALRDVADPGDLRDYLRGQFEKNVGAIDDIIQKDDPLPALGFLYPVALMLKHGKVSLGTLTSEAELSEDRPRRSFRAMIRAPSWRALLLTLGLFTIATFLSNYGVTADNVGWILDWPARLLTHLAGEPDTATFLGTLLYTLYNALTFLFLYLVSALVLRERRPDDPAQGRT
jgi:predicted ATP-grasp superfamily ATP-dependent carboligase